MFKQEYHGCLTCKIAFCDLVLCRILQVGRKLPKCVSKVSNFMPEKPLCWLPAPT